MLRILAVVVLLAPVFAHADPMAANSCAAQLPVDAKTIYDAVAAEFAAGNGRTDVRAKIMALVQAGKIDKSAVSQNAKAASMCLKQWK